MYRITQLHKPDVEVAEACSTVDAAIVQARAVSLGHPDRDELIGARIVVRDGAGSRLDPGRIRVMAYMGRAYWVAPCKPCKGKGIVPLLGATVGLFGYGGTTGACETCNGLGVLEDQPCD